MIVKRLIFFGQTATHACDGKCNKAWGINGRPTIPSRADLDKLESPACDDYAYLADDELGTAPVVTGITEDGQNKPINAKGPADINKWCVRECERAWISPPGQPDAVPELRDFSERRYNKAPHKRPALRLIDEVAASLTPAQAQKLVSRLGASQEQQFGAILKSSGPKKEDDP